MHGSLKLGIFCIAGLFGTVSFAQRAGGGRPPGGAPPGGGGGQGHPSPEEMDRAANAKKWEDLIERARANSPPPPLPKINFPSKNEMFLRSLCCCVDPPRVELARYLDTMWNGSSQPTARRAALDAFWQQAEKPKWARAAIEEFYRQRSNGQPLRPSAEELARKDATPPSTAPAGDGVTATVTPPPGGPTPPAAPPPATISAAPPADDKGAPPEPAVVPESKPVKRAARAADKP